MGHFALAKQVGRRILQCDPPYVIGVCGAWGSGKTSFLRKLWVYLGGSFDVDVKDPEKQPEQLRQEKLEAWFGADYRKPRSPKDKKDRNNDSENTWHVIWFNPWHHQFEQSPLVALLHEIRQHFSLTHRMIDEAGKLGDVATHATLSILGDLGKALSLPLPNVNTKGILERGREYEAEHFSTALTSQRFRDFFEVAITQVIGSEGRMVIFIDDLDRCEGEVVFRLLEALKLYLNARNCIYVLGLDQAHLEGAIARVLSGSEETWRYRPLARDYLNKMFQGLFLLPLPRSTECYVEALLNRNDARFKSLLANRFGMPEADWPKLIATLDRNLPHNPRKIKSFISSWKLYLDLLADQQPPGESLDWRLTVILNYLGQFEEPLFRRVEEFPESYSYEIVRFCRDGVATHPLFDGLELPYPEKDEVRSYTPPSPSGLDPDFLTSSSYASKDEEESGKTPSPSPRVFWISRLVNELAAQRGLVIREKMLELHLLRAGGALPPQAIAPPQIDDSI